MRTATSLRGTNIKRKQQRRLISFKTILQPVLGKKQFPGQRHLQNWGLDVNWAEIECNCCKSSFLWNCEGILMKIYILSFEFRIVIYNTRPWPPFGWDHGALLWFGVGTFWENVYFWMFVKKHHISQTKQQNIIRWGVVPIKEITVAPVSDGPGGEHHDEFEHNCSRLCQHLNWYRCIKLHYFKALKRTETALLYTVTKTRPQLTSFDGKTLREQHGP